MTTTYATRNEAIKREIIAALQASGEVADARAEFDIDAIADAVLGDHGQGYAVTVDTDAFWKVVAEHSK